MGVDDFAAQGVYLDLMRTLIALTTTVALSAGVPVAAAPGPDDDIERVLFVSVDGLNPRALSVLGPTRTPYLHRMLRNGAGTLNARTLYERTETLPNHTAMLTGIRTGLPRGSGVWFNADNGSTLEQSAGRYVPGIFDVVHDNGGSTAMYVAKDKFRFLRRSWNATHGAPDTTGADNGRNKVDTFEYDDAREKLLVAKLVTQLESAPATFTFLHLAGPDRAGHTHGGRSVQYLAAVRRTDALLGKVLRTIRRSATLRDHTLVVLTSDHGTEGRSHADPTKPVNYRIPFLTMGPGVSRGADLYRLNPELERPGNRRPGYSGRQPIRNGFVANLVADVLDLPVVPGSEFNRVRTLDLR